MFHTVRTPYLPALRVAGGSLRPARPQLAVAFRWQEGEHGGQDLSSG